MYKHKIESGAQLTLSWNEAGPKTVETELVRPQCLVRQTSRQYVARKSMKVVYVLVASQLQAVKYLMFFFF